jgi:soluble lytic murein transglycosylase
MIRTIAVATAAGAIFAELSAAPGAKVNASAAATKVQPPLPARNPQRRTDSAAQSDTAPEAPASAELTPEQDYKKTLTALVAPIRSYGVSTEDAQRLREALKAVGAGDIARARTLRGQLGDPAARKLVDWFALRNGFGVPADFTAFSEANPAWPDRQLLRRRAEEQAFVQGGSSQKIRAMFRDDGPQTGAGFAALASAYLAEKDEDRARETAAKAWREYELASTLEAGFLERFRALLSADDHKRRLDRILVDSVRFSSQRDDRAAIARRVIPLLPEAEQKKAEARLAVFLKAKTADNLLAALPAEAEGETDWGLAYQRVQHLRSLGKMDEVWKILTALPSDPDKLVSPDDWWMERRAAAYAALRADKPDIAYAVVRDPGPLSVNPLKDATFMAGWLALRHLDNAKAALPHFEASRAAADGPLTQARADYWLGRTFEALGRKDDARRHYAEAAKLFDTFHGQLARHKVEPGAPTLGATLPAMPTADEVKRFSDLDAVKAVGIAINANLDRGTVRMLIGHLRYALKTEGEVALLAQLAETLGDTQMVVRIGKTAIARGMNLVAYAYPVHTFPAYKPLRTPPETAMLLGIARQESEFNAAIISTAGARGLLQVMPITARHICRDHNVKCDVPRLLTDNSYNAMIASAYIGDRMAEFGGNYVLTLAGYNAGPGRAREWVRAFGDPRTPKIDPIDWIESIPIEETREYVKKVLANIQVYRARLGEAQALRLTQDLKLRTASE